VVCPPTTTTTPNPTPTTTPNGAPVFLTAPVTSVYLGDTYRYEAKASDDNNFVTIGSREQLPYWLREVEDDDNSGKAFFIGTPDKIGKYTIILVASDGKLDTIQKFEIEVKPKPVTPPPTNQCNEGEVFFPGKGCLVVPPGCYIGLLTNGVVVCPPTTTTTPNPTPTTTPPTKPECESGITRGGKCVEDKKPRKSGGISPIFVLQVLEAQNKVIQERDNQVRSNVSTINLASGPICRLVRGESYRVSNSSTVYYITNLCTRQIVPNEKTYYTYFKSFERVYITQEKYLNEVSMDQYPIAPYGRLWKNTQNTLVKVYGDSRVYFISGRDKYLLKDESAMKYLYGENAHQLIETINEELLNGFRDMGTFSAGDDYVEGAIIRDSATGKIYRYGFSSTKGKKVLKEIKTQEEFIDKKYRYDRLIKSEKVLDIEA
jgi:hypothetical protein